jgi:competence protein ComEC
VAFATIGAQIGTLPLLAALFGTIPLLGLLANLVAVPAFAFLLWCEIFLLFANPISHFVSASFAATINVLADFLHAFVEWFSAIPAASLTTGHLSLFALIGIYLGLAIMWFQKKQFEWKRAVLGALIVLNSLVWPEVFQWRKVDFEIYFLDVGNGDSILLQTPEKKTMLIDTGPAFDSWDASWRILPALRSLSIDTLDALVLTHTESDHIGGAAALVRDFPIRAVFASGQSNNTACFQKMTDELRARKLEAKALSAGDLVDALRPIPVWVLSPDSVWKMEGMNLNQRSLVLRVDIGQTSALFTGDIDSVTERRLVPWGDFLRSDLLKVPHHGSKASSSEAFLKAVRPKEAVITVGRRNPHGHPSYDVLERLDGLAISYHITGREGTLLWISDGETIALTSWRQSTLTRQWHLPTD